MVAQALASVRVAIDDDGLLVGRVKQGDEAAFCELYRRHAHHIAAVVYRLLGSDRDLDDIVQDTFVAGLGSLENLREVSALRCWLTTIAVRQVRRRLATRYLGRSLATALTDTLPPVSDVDAHEEVHGLYRALARLPERLRTPWMLHYVEGETLPDVAAVCESSLSSIKRRIAAASERLARMGYATS